MGKTLSDVPGLIRKRADFTIGNMSATAYFKYEEDSNQPAAKPGTLGFPPVGWNKILHPYMVRYVVYSYATPIGWIDASGLAVIPRQSHSNSTNRHQNRVYAGLKDDADCDRTHPDVVRARAEIERLHLEYNQAKEAARRERAREANRRRYWTPERIAAKEAREQAKILKEVVQRTGGHVSVDERTDEQIVLDSLARVTHITRDADVSSRVRHAS